MRLFLSGLGYLLADIASAWPMISLLLLGLGRVILGIGQSFAGTGSTLWGVGVVGRCILVGSSPGTYRHLRRNGDGRAAGRAVLCLGRVTGLALTVMGVALLAILLAFHVRR
ncbi:major facilitator superfamily transporter [Salmonella enterica subsp. enterica]|uniref:Major facilitator superfamily transporter n=1 Tax=Salmonella enterica I TaxID=59201 RepID=A0A379W153_SALET|nr:major facilitator superfamily transporter [Salmonella enterica subsp. enterica]